MMGCITEEGGTYLFVLDGFIDDVEGRVCKNEVSLLRSTTSNHNNNNEEEVNQQ